MGSVNVYSTTKIDELISSSVVGAGISNGQLSLLLRNGTSVPVGSIVSSVPDATDTTKGIVELATDTETIAGVDSTRSVTPLGLAALTATESRRGMIELATSAEVATGTDTSRAVTPAALASRDFVQKNITVSEVAPANPNQGQFTIGSVLRSWWNEWRALRGRNPYPDWADSLVRAVVMDDDNTSGNAFEIEDRRTGANGRKIWGVNWGTGRMVQNGNQVGAVYVLTASQTVSDIPSTLPIGTLVVQRTS